MKKIQTRESKKKGLEINLKKKVYLHFAAHLKTICY